MMYPQSFINETVSKSKNNFIEIRSDLKTMDDINKWILEYQQETR